MRIDKQLFTMQIILKLILVIKAILIEQFFLRIDQLNKPYVLTIVVRGLSVRIKLRNFHL